MGMIFSSSRDAATTVEHCQYIGYEGALIVVFGMLIMINFSYYIVTPILYDKRLVEVSDKLNFQNQSNLSYNQSKTCLLLQKTFNINNNMFFEHLKNDQDIVKAAANANENIDNPIHSVVTAGISSVDINSFSKVADADVITSFKEIYSLPNVIEVNKWLSEILVPVASASSSTSAFVLAQMNSKKMLIAMFFGYIRITKVLLHERRRLVELCSSKNDNEKQISDKYSRFFISCIHYIKNECVPFAKNVIQEMKIDMNSSLSGSAGSGSASASITVDKLLEILRPYKLKLFQIQNQLRYGIDNGNGYGNGDITGIICKNETFPIEYENPPGPLMVHIKNILVLFLSKRLLCLFYRNNQSTIGNLIAPVNMLNLDMYQDKILFPLGQVGYNDDPDQRYWTKMREEDNENLELITKYAETNWNIAKNEEFVLTNNMKKDASASYNYFSIQKIQYIYLEFIIDKIKKLKTSCPKLTQYYGYYGLNRSFLARVGYGTLVASTKTNVYYVYLLYFFIFFKFFHDMKTVTDNFRILRDKKMKIHNNESWKSIISGTRIITKDTSIFTRDELKLTEELNNVKQNKEIYYYLLPIIIIFIIVYPNAYLYNAFISNQKATIFQNTFLLSSGETLIALYGVISVHYKTYSYYSFKLLQLPGQYKLWTNYHEKYWNIIEKIQSIHIFNCLIPIFFGFFHVIALTPHCYNPNNHNFTFYQYLYYVIAGFFIVMISITSIYLFFNKNNLQLKETEIDMEIEKEREEKIELAIVSSCSENMN